MQYKTMSHCVWSFDDIRIHGGYCVRCFFMHFKQRYKFSIINSLRSYTYDEHTHTKKHLLNEIVIFSFFRFNKVARVPCVILRIVWHYSWQPKLWWYINYCVFAKTHKKKTLLWSNQNPTWETKLKQCQCFFFFVSFSICIRILRFWGNKNRFK